jgi:hypothetical protein
LKDRVWCKNAPLVQKFASTGERLSVFKVFSRPATSHPANDLPSNQFPKRFGATAFHAPKAAREKTVFRLVIFSATAKIFGRIIFKT